LHCLQKSEENLQFCEENIHNFEDGRFRLITIANAEEKKQLHACYKDGNGVFIRVLTGQQYL